MREASDAEPPYAADAAIRVGLSAREQVQTRWGLLLVIFMRLLAGLWILQGRTTRCSTTSGSARPRR